MTATFNFSQYEPTEDLEASLNFISRVVGTLSLLGCIFNIVATVCLGKSKVILGKMVIILAVFDILNHFPWVFDSFSSTTSLITCEYIGSWLTYFGYASSLFFTTCFAHSLYQSIKIGSIDCINRYFIKYIAVSTIAGITVGSLAVGLQFREYTIYPDGHTLCTNQHIDKFNWNNLLVIFLPELINIIACMVYYILIIRMLKSLDEKRHWGLLIYPLILVICILPAVTRKFLGLIGVDKAFKNYTFKQFTRGLFGAQGLLNSFAYGLSREIYVTFKQKCCPSRMSESLVNSLSFLDISSEDETEREEKQHPIN